MEHDTFDNESDNDNDDDGEEVTPRTPQAGRQERRRRTAPEERWPRPVARWKEGRALGKESERKKRELITMGKAKGFLTYDEVNEHMPENIVSSDQMDDWLSAFSA